jgi:hypothetical protein
MAIAVPRLDFSRYRIDAAAQNVRSVLMQAQRTALIRQYDVTVSIDTAAQALRTAEDVNNDGVIQPNEHKRTYSLNDGMIFLVPPKGLDTTVTKPLIGPHLGSLGGLPTVTFHRDGATTTDLQLYIGTPAGSDPAYRAIRLDHATGRTDWYRYNTAAGKWLLGGSQ